MSSSRKIVFIFLSSLFLSGGPAAFAEWSLDLETGAVFSGYNDVQIPKETGTRFSLSEDLEINPEFFFRARVTYSFKKRHHISGFAAPLRLDASGKADRPIRFNEVEFGANIPLKARYRFDSYRLTYRYDVHRRERLTLGIGFTAKIRDASISLQDADKKTEKKDTGFVPLLNFKVDWRFTKGFGLLLEGDALAAPQGRAEDVLMAMQYKLNKKVTLKVGYRFLEGGADVDEVYNFTLVSYVAVGSIIMF
ncbi:MAG: hypothetical protein GTO24_09575 [candidate division Zixibacteria bacterium]|nr:hypothetical protein [candidate division Zixibacteria bacterium]